MLGHIRVIMSSPTASVAAMLLGIAGKVGMIRVFFTTNSDKIAHALMARNLMKGHGLTINTSSLTDLSKLHYVQDIGWPPGYSLMLNLFPFALENNFVLACFLIDILCVVLFFFYCRKLLLLIGLPVWSTNLFLIFQGFFLVSTSSSTDFPAMVFVVAALYHMVRLFQSTELSTRDIVWISIFLLLAAFIRYQYMPVAACMAASMFLVGILQKQRPWWIAGMIVLFTIMACCGGFLLYQQSQTGSAAYVVPVRRGWFFSNLLEMHPFIVTAFINMHFYAVQLSTLTPVGYGDWFHLAQWISLPLVVVFIFMLSNQMLRKRFRSSTTWDSFLLFGFVGFAASVAVLVLLSLRLHEAIGPPLYNWTYVMEKRYFMFAVFFLQVWVWRNIFLEKSASRELLHRAIRWAFTFVVICELAHGMYYIVKQQWNGLPAIRDLALHQSEQAIVAQYIEDSRRRDPQRHVVVTGFYKRYGFLAGLYGASGMFTPLALSKQLPASSRPAVLLGVFEKRSLPLLETFLRRPGVQLVAETPGSCIYSLLVEPAISDTIP